MKKWRVILCGIGVMVMLAACGSNKDDIQIVEEESISELPQETKEKEGQEEEEASEEVQQSGETEEETTEEATASEDKPAVVTIEAEEQEYKDGDKVLMTTSYANVTVEVEENETATQAVMAEFEKRKEEFQESVADSVEWAKEDSLITDSGMSYSQEREYATARNDGRVLSFSEFSSGYEGGAHGYYMEYGLNFDAKTGQVLTIADITQDKAAFQEICVKKMRETYDELRAQGRGFEEEMIVPSLQEVFEGKMEGEEWYFTEDGIRFISNIYEVAPYAEGKVIYDIPYEMINDVLKEEYRG